MSDAKELPPYTVGEYRYMAMSHMLDVWGDSGMQIHEMPMDHLRALLAALPVAERCAMLGQNLDAVIAAERVVSGTLRARAETAEAELASERDWRKQIGLELTKRLAEVSELEAQLLAEQAAHTATKHLLFTATEELEQGR